MFNFFQFRPLGFQRFLLQEKQELSFISSFVNMASRKRLRDLFNLRYTRCRICERSKAELLVNGAARRRSKVKPLFHARPWIRQRQSQCLHRQSNNSIYWNRFTQEVANMAEEVEEMRTRFEEVRREPHRVRQYLRLLYNESESRFEEMD